MTVGCCIEGECVPYVATEAECRAAGGYPLNNITCTGDPCNPANVVGCCDDGECYQTTADQCIGAGHFVGQLGSCIGADCPQPGGCRETLEPIPGDQHKPYSRDLCEAAISAPVGSAGRATDMVTMHETRAVYGGLPCNRVRSQVVMRRDGRVTTYMCNSRREPPTGDPKFGWSVGRPFVRRTPDPNGFVRIGRAAIKNAVQNPYWRVVEAFAEARVCVGAQE